MGRSSTPPDFTIHVDPSCLTESTDLDVPLKPEASADATVHTTPSQESDGHVKSGEISPKQSIERPDIFDERIQAQIHEAARKVVEDIERDRFEDPSASTLSTQTDESYDQETELTYGGSEVTYDDTEGTYETEDEEHAEADADASILESHIDQPPGTWDAERGAIEDEVEDSSSQHDGDVDDVFSDNSGQSQRSSINSIHDLSTSDEAYQKILASPSLGEEAASSHAIEPVSRIPSTASYTPDETEIRTPSRGKHRPPFRTPSSVRAIQMSSPTPSIFSSPRSIKRHLQTGSRIGTPTSQFSPSKRTPTRFKAKKEEPLVLLHATLMPLQWAYAHVISTSDTLDSLQHVKESWGLLQEKLTDTVLERGVLLAHPQESYEVLEERLLEALELPVRPRARILKCGHYMGPLDLEMLSSDDENVETQSFFRSEAGTERKWCDICRKDVKLQDTGESCGKRRFNVKIYASNGLMRAGAWAAAWREMERVDVEIEPWVELEQRSQIEALAASAAIISPLAREVDDDFVDEEDSFDVKVLQRNMDNSSPQKESDEHRQSIEERELRRKFEEEELAHRMREEEQLQSLLAEERALEQRIQEEEAHRKLVEEEREREIYGQPVAAPSITKKYEPGESRVRSQDNHKPSVNPDSLPELLFAAFKVLLRDKKNIAIGLLSIVVVLLALKPAKMKPIDRPKDILNSAVPVVEIDTLKETINYVTITATSTVEAAPQTVTKFEEVTRPTLGLSPDIAKESSVPTETDSQPEVDVEDLNAEATLEETLVGATDENDIKESSIDHKQEDTTIEVHDEETAEASPETQDVSSSTEASAHEDTSPPEIATTDTQVEA